MIHARLYLVLTPQVCTLAVTEVVARALQGGVEMVQLRDKKATDEDFLKTAKSIREICRVRSVPFLLNDRLHLVKACGAGGVHLGEDDASPEEARGLLGPDRLIGISTHDRAEVAAATGRGADYAGLGPMFATGTKRLSRTPRGPELVREVIDAADLPLFPIGGITAENLPLLIAAGAGRAAVSGAICSARDPMAAAAELRSLLPAS
jgi:thiamine-phosphate diphosphorylase